nr:protein fantom-like [Paramormyrops kingsleyae]
MPLAVDETAGDLPVRDLGPRGGLVPSVYASPRNVKSMRKPQVLKIKDRWPMYRMSREQLEDQCSRLQEENTILKQHCRTQERKMRRLSTKVMQLQQRHPGPGGAWEKELDETVQELEARVATLETQKEALQSKLDLAKQQFLELGNRAHSRVRGRVPDRSRGVRRAALTAPPHCGLISQADSHGEMGRPATSMQQSSVEELELTALSMTDSVRERESEVTEALRELRRQQAGNNRVAIQENLDVIHLQKQLADKGAALLVIQEKVNVLRESYEARLVESQKALKECQEALLQKVGELTEELKQERQKTLTMEGQLSTAMVSVQALEEFQERVADLERERNLLKDSYDGLLESTITAQDHQKMHAGQMDKNQVLQEQTWRVEIHRLQEELRVERQEKERLEKERKRMQQETNSIEELQQRERNTKESEQEKHASLEKEVLHCKEIVTSLQEKLDSVAEAFDMSVEDLSETLLQIKKFRLMYEAEERLRFLGDDVKVEEGVRELADLRATHAETVLELRKTREMLLLQSRINKDFQAELNIVKERAEREREESQKRTAEKDRQLERRAQRITTLQAQLKDLAYSPRSYKRTIPLQYNWAGGGQEEGEDDLIFGQLQPGESLLEIHLSGASFTSAGLRAVTQSSEPSEREASGQKVMTFCTYALLDFEMHSTPLVSGVQPNYGFTSRYPLSPLDFERLGKADGRIRAELHQALGGIQFVTCGDGWIPLSGAMERRGERVNGKASITDVRGEIIGILEFWVRIYPPVQLTCSLGDRQTLPSAPSQGALSWQGYVREEMFDFGGGIPNELEVVLERGVDLSAHWPGLLPDAYLLYRLYDLPPHVSPTIPCCTNPVFNDSASYPLAMTQDVLAYLHSNSLWVYVFDDRDDRLPPSYLAKTPIPLRPLSVGRQVRGDFVLRDSGGRPRGMVRVSLRWKYPFQSPEVSQTTKAIDREEQECSRQLHRPTAKPRTKTGLPKCEMVCRDSHTPSRPLSAILRRPGSVPFKAPESERGPSHWSADLATPCLVSSGNQVASLQPPARKRTSRLRSHVLVRGKPQPTSLRPANSPILEFQHKEGPSVEDEAGTNTPVGEEDEDEECGRNEKVHVDSDVTESGESRASSDSDVIIVPKPSELHVEENKLHVEILSLSFHSTSNVALDQSVQQVYVEYRLFGVPMETTETPMSLRKPTCGEEIHYNFTRVIYVDRAEAAPLRQYLYTMLEGTDPNHGRLKFTVVSEPMDEQEEECVDIGHAYLDLQELLLTGNDVIERKIDIYSVGEDLEVVGKLKVSLEAAQTLTGIYWEYRNLREREDEQKKYEEGKTEAEDMSMEPLQSEKDDDCDNHNR